MNTVGNIAPAWRSSELVYLTAYQMVPLGPPVDLATETWRLHRATMAALDSANIAATVDVHYMHHEIVVRVYTPDADRAFARLERVFREWPDCGRGYVLLRYGPPGARERQVSLAEQDDEGKSSRQLALVL